MATEMRLLVDPERAYKGATGIVVRAELDDRYGPHDIAELEARSLLLWLRSRGGKNVWAEDVVLLLLGHGQAVNDLEDTDDS